MFEKRDENAESKTMILISALEEKTFRVYYHGCKENIDI